MTESSHSTGKRVAEALTYGYHRQDNVDVRVSRIFNCYGQSLVLHFVQDVVS